jgi:trk system potassium uptake protein TrkH
LKPKRDNFYRKEGFALTALAWIVMALFGAIPFVISKDIPNYINACFEIMSGFTTTGSSIITDITKNIKGMNTFYPELVKAISI